MPDIFDPSVPVAVAIPMMEMPTIVALDTAPETKQMERE
jgi:hypothetical protein